MNSLCGCHDFSLSLMLLSGIPSLRGLAGKHITMFQSLFQILREDGGEIDGSRVNFPLHLGETPTHSTEKQSKQPKAAQRL